MTSSRYGTTITRPQACIAAVSIVFVVLITLWGVGWKPTQEVGLVFAFATLIAGSVVSGAAHILSLAMLEYDPQGARRAQNIHYGAGAVAVAALAAIVWLLGGTPL